MQTCNGKAGENNRLIMNEAFNIQLAGVVIRIEPLYGFIRDYCRGYITEKPESITVRVSEEDIAYERRKSASEDRKEGIPVRDFPDSYLETLAVYRKIAGLMLNYDTFLFHGSVIAVDGFAYMFTAKSGTGKSTHTRLWREMLGDRAVMINDDKPLISASDSGITAYGTPWDGKHRLSANIGAPLKALCVLERAEENRISEITKADCYNMLVQQVYKPAEPQMLIKTLQLIDRLAAGVRLYRLGCNMNPEAAYIAFAKMSEA